MPKPIKKDTDNDVYNYMVERLKEPSTWKGFVIVLAACGVPIAPAMADQIIAVGLAVSGLIGIVTADKK